MAKKIAILVAGLLWGDENKGATVDWLARYLQRNQLPLNAVFLTNGGSQRAHTVKTNDGRIHVFRQLGSASFVPGTISHLSSFMLVDPVYLFQEIFKLQNKGVPDIRSRLTVHRDARIITPLQIAANRLRERDRDTKRHGSCGQGVGETQQDFTRYGKEVCLTIGELSDRHLVRQKLQRLLDLKIADLAEIIKKFQSDPDAAEEIRTFTDKTIFNSWVDLYSVFADHLKVVDDTWVREILDKPGTVVFEQSQGALLDPEFGFPPYVTWTKTTFTNADTLLSENQFDGQRVRLGLLRAYAHRHGPGPFPSYDQQLTELLPDPNNPTNPWQLNFRVGYFDPIMVKYALEVLGGVDFLGIGHLDQLPLVPEWKIVDHYQIPEPLAQIVASESKGESVYALKFHNPPNQDYQVQLTEAINLAQPIYTAGFKDARGIELLAFMANKFNVPFGLVAFGPTADDRISSADFDKVFK